jgi:hypothetical protein
LALKPKRVSGRVSKLGGGEEFGVPLGMGTTFRPLLFLPPYTRDIKMGIANGGAHSPPCATNFIDSR